jgi:Tol biopolymer transport system component
MSQGTGGTRALRRFVLRWLIVGAVGAAVLVAILYYASTVDLQPPSVSSIGLTQRLPGSPTTALTNTSLEVTFSELVEHDTAEAALRISPAVSGTYSWSGTTMVFTPRQRLPLATKFAISIGPGVRDLAGNASNGTSGSFAFTTVGEPRVVATAPADEAIDVPVGTSIQLTFSTLMDTASVERSLQIIPSTPVTLRWSGERLTIVPSDPLLPDQRYIILLGNPSTDLAGTPLAPELRLAFQTQASTLAADQQVPADGSQGIAVGTPIAVFFDRPLATSGANASLLSISPQVAGTTEIVAPEGAAATNGAARTVLRFTPSGPLPADTTFTVTVARGVRAADGTQLPVELQWTFTTGAASTTLSNQVLFLSARSGVANLWAMNPDGSNQRQLSSELSPVSSYAVAPDGRSFVVGDGVRLIEERVDGTGRTVLTNAGSAEYDPVFSPDGSELVFGRANLATGAGLGLWERPTSGGAATQLVAPGPVAASPTPVPSSTGSPTATSSTGGAPAPVAALLRVPRFSPDGTHLAFADTSGRVAILDLGSGTLTSGRFAAAAPPAWLPDGSGILVSGFTVDTGSAGGTPGTGPHPPGTPIGPLSPDGLLLTPAERARLTVVELDTGAPDVRWSLFMGGVSAPIVARDGSVAYVVYATAEPGGGDPWVMAPDRLDTRELVPRGGFLATSLAFAPDDSGLVAARVPAGEGDASVRGIWFLPLDAAARQLSTDGWLPRWLP